MRPSIKIRSRLLNSHAAHRIHGCFGSSFASRCERRRIEDGSNGGNSAAPETRSENRATRPMNDNSRVMREIRRGAEAIYQHADHQHIANIAVMASLTVIHQ